MTVFKYILLAIALSTSAAFAQEMATEDLPTATIDANYYVTLDNSQPLSEYYKVDISHLSFADEMQAKKLLGIYVTGNLITNEVNYSENQMIIHIHTEYATDPTVADIQEYLGTLTKPE